MRYEFMMVERSDQRTTARAGKPHALYRNDLKIVSLILNLVKNSNLYDPP